MSLTFYKAFEDKYRGSRDLIKSRLQVYLPFVQALKSIYPEAQALDLGCGRGEWLECLQAMEISAIGVDTDDNMLEICRLCSLEVVKQNAIDYLQQIPDNSQVIISAFHLAEHLSFSQLQTLAQEALKKLQPGGLLIIETPNPENIVVGSSRFYLDPTHQKPLPPELLSFIPEHYGFKRVKVLRLQEEKQLMTSGVSSILEVLNGVSPDFAVVAQKEASPKLLGVLDSQFKQNYGITLKQLGDGYDEKVVGKINKLTQHQHALEFKLSESVERLQSLESRLQLLEIEFYTLLNSRSWRLTQPLRSISRLARAIKTSVIQTNLLPISFIKNKLKILLGSGIKILLNHRRLITSLDTFLTYTPRVKNRLKSLAFKYKSFGNPTKLETIRTQRLSPLSSSVLADLKKEIRKH